MTTDNPSQKANQPTVGKRLRQAREIAGLSMAEVAAAQHLRPAIISAIESGDFRSIDSELFLKGYVRAYATQVGIDPESVVRQLDKELEPLREEKQARVEASPLVSIERRKRRKRQIAKIVGVLLVLAALFYAGTLYLASQEAPAEPATEESVPGEVAETDASLSEPSADEGGNLVKDDTRVEVPVIDSESSEGDRQEAEMLAEAGESRGAAAEPGEVEATSMVEGTEPLPQTSGQPVDESAPLTDTGSGSSTETRALPEQEPSAPVDNQGRLMVEFSDDCWVEVQDSTGRTLVAELRRAGETLDVNGDGPLRVVLGAVSAVSTLSYSGDTVNLSDRRARNNRLVLNLSD